MLKFWLISDTHGQHESLIVPQGIDGIIHSGDGGTYKNPHRCKEDMESCLTWLDAIPVKYKLYVPGNHDTALEKELIDLSKYPTVHVVEHGVIELAGLKIFGSAWTPWFFEWAYNATPPMLERLWNDIPKDVDIVVTHGPAFGILDQCHDGKKAGCELLLKKLQEVKPRFHICGHIHEEGGKKIKVGRTTFINASVLDLTYSMVNNGTIIKV